MKVGFCGLGAMGVPMVERLLAAGHEVTVWNRDADKTRALVARGARRAPTPRSLGCDSDLAMLCLLDATAVEQVVFGANGIAGSQRCRILVDHSSIPPETTRAFAGRLAQHGCTWVDAPVSGGVPGARAGRLVVMAGGTVEAIDAVRPLLAAYASRTTRTGGIGTGQLAKLCNQTIVAAAVVALAEALALARGSNLDPAVLHEALQGGWADSKVLQTFLPRMAGNPPDHIGAIATMLKDVDAVVAEGISSQTPTPISGAVQDLLRRCVHEGGGAKDLSRVIEAYSRPRQYLVREPSAGGRGKSP